MRSRKNTRMLVVFAFALVGLALVLSGCFDQKRETQTPSPLQAIAPDNGVAEFREMERHVAENEAVRLKVERFVRVTSGHLILDSAVDSIGLPSEALADLREAFQTMNAQADAGQISIMADMTISTRTGRHAQTAWSGIRHYWWGFELGVPDNMVHTLVSGSYEDALNLLLLLAGPTGRAVAGVVYVSRLIIRYLDWSCNHTGLVVRRYWWSGNLYMSCM